MFLDVDEISKTIDRHLSDWTPETLNETFLKHGCSVVRQAVPREKLAAIQGAVERAFSEHPGLHIYDEKIRAQTGGVSAYTLVDDPKLKQFRDLVYQGQNYQREDATARRVKGTGTNEEGTFEPLPLHLDSYFHDFRFTVNFWVPFYDCGVTSPTLQVLPLDYVSTRNWSGFTGDRLNDEPQFNGRFFKKGCEIPEQVVLKEFGEKSLFRPVMRAGDLVIASNWVLHGSYRTPAMPNGRMSIEIRFIGEHKDVRLAEATTHTSGTDR